MTTNIAVIIPFYQAEDGILRRALESVETQQLPTGVTLKVVVVDDASPHPASKELDGFAFKGAHTLTIIKQTNSGPAGARNTGLNSLAGDEIDFVSFLDSDDIWNPLHIQRALSALRKSDFFFCNHVRSKHYGDYFRCLPETWQALTQNRGAGQSQMVKVFAAGELTRTMIRECPPQTSTVLYNFRKNPNLRFNASLRSAGEDHIFWIELSIDNSTAVDVRVNVSCGEGLNLYWSNVSWESPKSISIQGCLAIQYNYMRNNDRIYTMDIETISFRQRLYEGAYVYAILRGAAKRFLPDPKVFSKLVSHYPAFLLRSPANLAFFVMNRKVMTDVTSVKNAPSADLAA
jgi:succinoglycan biosynthesis protein ExoW